MIDDSSGSIDVRQVGSSVTIDDGSGSIRVSDVAKDLIILGDGSGSVSFSDVRGTVDEDGQDVSGKIPLRLIPSGKGEAG